MTEIVFAHEELSLDDEAIPVYLSSDHRLFVCLADLCELLGLDWKIQHLYIMTDPYLRDQLVLFQRGKEPSIHKRRDTIFLDLVALSYWLGTLTRTPICSRKARDRVMRFTQKYVTYSWDLMNRGFIPARESMPVRVPTELIGFSKN